jgi:hypothetical protein
LASDNVNANVASGQPSNPPASGQGELAPGRLAKRMAAHTTGATKGRETVMADNRSKRAHRASAPVRPPFRSPPLLSKGDRNVSHRTFGAPRRGVVTRRRTDLCPEPFHAPRAFRPQARDLDLTACEDAAKLSAASTPVGAQRRSTRASRACRTCMLQSPGSVRPPSPTGTLVESSSSPGAHPPRGPRATSVTVCCGGSKRRGGQFAV